MKNLLALIFTALLVAPVAHAETDPAAEEKIRNSLKILLPNLVPDTVRATPAEGFYEVTFGSRLVYVTGDGRFLFQGKMIDLETRTELTEQRLSALKKEALDKLDESQMVVYGPEDAEHTVTVFTDIDCGFCRRLHQEMAQYNEEGIRIRYLFYPRAGIGSDSYDKAVSVWCADDRRNAMDLAKAGKAIDKKSCENPVDEHYALGQAMRLQGTPALMFENGEMVPGYVPPKKLRQALDQSSVGKGG
jgi:thiol:disulfide interchange protein DsbC